MTFPIICLKVGFTFKVFNLHNNPYLGVREKTSKQVKKYFSVPLLMCQSMFKKFHSNQHSKVKKGWDLFRHPVYYRSYSWHIFHSVCSCNHVVVPDTEDTHEDFCGFRSITCRQTDCSEKIQVSFMMEHYKTHHPNRILVTSSTENHCWPDFRPGEDATVNTPGFLDQHFFYISRHYSSDEQHQRFTLEAFYVGKPTAEYFLTVRCERGDVVCSKTIKPIVMLGNSDLDGLAVICKTEVDSSDLFLKVSRSFLPYFVNDDKQLEFTYKLFRL